MAASTAWNILRDLIEQDERVAFLDEPEGIDRILPGLLRYPVPTSSLIADAYLAAFAIAASSELATFDSGFRQFSGLRVKLL
jgi:predicted nucleic acid-binding protein